MALPEIKTKLTVDDTELVSGLARANSEIDAFSKQAGGAAGKTSSVAKGFSALAGNSRNLAMQMSQVAQMTMATGKPMQALAIQLPDMAMGFGTLGMVVGTLAGVALPILVDMFMQSGEKAKTLKERIDELNTISGGLKSTQDILSLSVQELRDKYGQYADAIKNAAENLALLQAAEARTKIGNIISEMDAVFRQYTESANTAWSSGTMLFTALSNIKKELGLSADQAVAFEGAMSALRDATTFDEQQAALIKVGDLLKENNVDLEKIPPELRKAIIEASNLAIQMAEVATQARNAAAASAGMNTGVPLTVADITPPPKPGEGAYKTRGGMSEADRLKKQMETRLETLKGALATESETVQVWYDNGLETLQANLDNKTLKEEEYRALREKLEQEHQNRMNNITQAVNDRALGVYSGFFGAMASLAKAGGEKTFKAYKAFAIAQAVVDSYRAYTQMLADPFFIGRPFMRYVAAASILASGLAQVAAINKTNVGSSGASSTASSAAGGGASAAPTHVANYTVTGDVIGKATGGELIRSINDAIKAGYQINLEWT